MYSRDQSKYIVFRCQCFLHILEVKLMFLLIIYLESISRCQIYLHIFEQYDFVQFVFFLIGVKLNGV